MGCAPLRAASLRTSPVFSLQGVKTWGKVVDVYDGDTLTVAVRRPMRTSFRVRLQGIDTEEIRQPKGAADREARTARAYQARDRLIMLTTGVVATGLKGEPLREALMNARRCVWVEFGEMDKYGRPLATIRARGVKVNSALVEEGLALPYDGGTKQAHPNSI